MPKRLRTRAKLVDAAVRLVAHRGYENTTVDQIAGAVDVSPRTVANHFPSKDQLLVALVEGMAAAIEAEFLRLPDDVPVLAALCRAHAVALENVANSGADIGVDRVAVLLSTVKDAPRLQMQIMTRLLEQVADPVARRLGLDPRDRQVSLIAGLWVGVARCAWSDLGAEVTVPGMTSRDMALLLNDQLQESVAAMAALGRG
ncbi:hypothetical protein MBRU_00130 [Mycolicibacterium brumae DSM 44177]|nr:hypothetical protein MBRU_00130 [Mycolicibacterium brumae DSM 44177]